MALGDGVMQSRAHPALGGGLGLRMLRLKNYKFNAFLAV